MWRVLDLRRVKLKFAPGLEVEFCDRDRALKQVYEFAERGTVYPIVVYGPEGCGKTAWLIQAIEVLKELGFNVIYFNPLRKEFEVDVGVEDLKQKALEVLRRVTSEVELAKLVWLVIDFANEALKYRKGRLAVIVDDVFQFMGVREAAAIVKSLLNIIEYPPTSYESIVVLVATNEGVSKREIGRHRWALIRSMWNMNKDGFKELYDMIPGPKTSFEDIWRLCGGNPDILRRLYQAYWNVEHIVKDFITSKDISKDFIVKWRLWLEKAVEDPDIINEGEFPDGLREELIEKNFIFYIYFRDLELWIDEPPPRKNLDIGVSEYVAWQTPLHREVIKKALEMYK
ncbi:MAG: ATP-binding protein [Sulfolobales archaeon]